MLSDLREIVLDPLVFLLRRLEGFFGLAAVFLGLLAVLLGVGPYLGLLPERVVTGMIRELNEKRVGERWMREGGKVIWLLQNA